MLLLKIGYLPLLVRSADSLPFGPVDNDAIIAPTLPVLVFIFALLSRDSVANPATSAFVLLTVLRRYSKSYVRQKVER